MIKRKYRPGWLLWGGTLLILFPFILPELLLAQVVWATGPETDPSPHQLKQFDSTNEVYLCRRLVDDWRVQLIFPGVEHYSIWLPEKKLHRGVTATGLAQPLQWVDEFYFGVDETRANIARKGYTCEPIAGADLACIEREMTQRQDAGQYGLTNQCQNVALALLAQCGGQVPSLTPLYQTPLLSSTR